MTAPMANLSLIQNGGLDAVNWLYLQYKIIKLNKRLILIRRLNAILYCFNLYPVSFCLFVCLF